MGDPKFPSKHYNTPSHPWQKVRIDQEKTLLHQYGLKNKKEIWKANTQVRSMRRQARKLTANSGVEQSQKEKNLLLAKLNRLGILEPDAGLEDILRMSPESVLDRRLQTQVYLQGLSSTVNQARQLIIHGHISVDGAVNRVPGMIVTKLQEKKIIYSPSSALNSDLHPVRPGSQETYNNSESEEDDENKSSEKENTEQTVVKDNNKDEINEKKENAAKEQKPKETK